MAADEEVVGTVKDQLAKLFEESLRAIMTNLPPSEMIESCSIAGPSFVNVKLSRQWIAKSIQKMLIKGIETWSLKLQVKRAVVHFSSPNIAKEMHVGRLRSTIIGDTLACMLEFSNVKVLRRNHVGDWGTQVASIKAMLFALGLSTYTDCW
ncbi:hypothetical protein C3L33_00970, partial [Rhododendron williamsianum]